MKKRCKKFSVLGLTALILLGNIFSVSAGEETSKSVFSPHSKSDSAHIVAIDPGHQGSWIDMSAPEPNGPDSSTNKARCTSGTTGSYSRLPEYQLNLDVSLRLKEELTDRGYEVVMTREDNDANISNKERAQLASASNAEIYVRIHANGSEDSSVHGAIAIYPSPSNPYIPELSQESQKLSTSILNSYCDKTGIFNKGIETSDTMTGINWSTIPVTILELGFMTNKNDDLKMADKNFQITMTEGIADGIDAYFSDSAPKKLATEEKNTARQCEAYTGGPISDSHTEEGQLSAPSSKKSSLLEADTSYMDKLKKELPTKLQEVTAGNGDWSLYVYDLRNGVGCSIGADQMQAASLIKLFIMGAVYESYDSLCKTYGSSTIDQELTKMITVSDNTSANNLVSYLGGMDAVNNFCIDHDFFDTEMGRLLLASNASGDNYTSVEDCGTFLTAIYNNSSEFPHAKDMMNLLCKQERRNKIPAGLHLSSCVCANKTGELDDVENDAAIVFQAPRTDFILCIMSENLKNTASAQSAIASISEFVYQSLNS